MSYCIIQIIVLAVVFSYIMKIFEKEQKGVLYNREVLLKETKAKAASPVTFFIGKFTL